MDVVPAQPIMLGIANQRSCPKATIADVLCVIGRCIYDCISTFQVEVEDFDNEIFVGKKTNLLADRLYSTWCFIVKADSYEYIRG